MRHETDCQPSPTVTAYACPMHTEVVSDQPGHCPKCGMKLLAAVPERPATGDHHHVGIGHSVMDHSIMDHSVMENAGMDHTGGDDSGMDHAGMDRSGMDHGSRTASSGRTTWLRPTARPPCTGGSWIGPAVPTALPSTGGSPSAT